MQFSIGEVAKMSGVSIRMLRHYDEIGLLVPSDRTLAGYRQYEDADLLRLQRILSLRATGMGLSDIATALEGGADKLASLESQALLLRGKIELMTAQLAAVERARRAEVMGVNLNPEELFEVFGEDDPTQYADEAKERWGETDAYQESARRTSGYSKADWLEVQEEQQAVIDGFLAALRAGLPAESEEAMAAAEAHRLSIDQRFYPCSHEMQVNLAEMYLADARFTEYYEKHCVGLAQYVAAAIFANAVRHS